MHLFSTPKKNLENRRIVAEHWWNAEQQDEKKIGDSS